ncbi:MAG TPA: hypothetical protein VJ903_01075 [Clostridia bacterium]|nr:hypothetical protein [Clostridia bacterium]
MKKQIFSRILSIISILVLMPTSVITMYMTISFINMTHTEGTGIVIVPIIILNLINIGISLIFNVVAYILLPKTIKNDKVKRRNWTPLIIILLSILIFIIELVIVL